MMEQVLQLGKYGFFHKKYTVEIELYKKITLNYYHVPE